MLSLLASGNVLVLVLLLVPRVLKMIERLTALLAVRGTTSSDRADSLRAVADIFKSR
jgi:hypothetical protein